MVPARYPNPESSDLMTDPNNRQHREINYELCRDGINLSRLHTILDKMEVAGMHPSLVNIYKTQADVLLTLLRSENNRIHGY